MTDYKTAEVDLTGLVDGDTLVYNASTGKFHPALPSSGSSGVDTTATHFRYDIGYGSYQDSDTYSKGDLILTYGGDDAGTSDGILTLFVMDKAAGDPIGYGMTIDLAIRRADVEALIGQQLAAIQPSFYPNFAEYPASYYLGPMGQYVAGIAGGNQWEICVPYPVVARGTGTVPMFDRIGVNVNTTSPGETFRLGIRDHTDGIPANLLVDSGELPADTTGWQEADINWAPEPGLYFVSIRFEGPSARVDGVSSGSIAGLPQTSSHRRGYFLDSNPGVAGTAMKPVYEPFGGPYDGNGNGTQSTDADTGPHIQLRVIAPSVVG